MASPFAKRMLNEVCKALLVFILLHISTFSGIVSGRPVRTMTRPPRRMIGDKDTSAVPKRIIAMTKYKEVNETQELLESTKDANEETVDDANAEAVAEDDSRVDAEEDDAQDELVQAQNGEDPVGDHSKDHIQDEVGTEPENSGDAVESPSVDESLEAEETQEDAEEEDLVEEEDNSVDSQNENSGDAADSPSVDESLEAEPQEDAEEEDLVEEEDDSVDSQNENSEDAVESPSVDESLEEEPQEDAEEEHLVEEEDDSVDSQNDHDDDLVYDDSGDHTTNAGDTELVDQEEDKVIEYPRADIVEGRPQEDVEEEDFVQEEEDEPVHSQNDKGEELVADEAEDHLKNEGDTELVDQDENVVEEYPSMHEVTEGRPQEDAEVDDLAEEQDETVHSQTEENDAESTGQDITVDNPKELIEDEDDSKKEGEATYEAVEYPVGDDTTGSAPQEDVREDTVDGTERAADVGFQQMNEEDIRAYGAEESLADATLEELEDKIYSLEAEVNRVEAERKEAKSVLDVVRPVYAQQQITQGSLQQYVEDKNDIFSDSVPYWEVEEPAVPQLEGLQQMLNLSSLSELSDSELVEFFKSAVEELETIVESMATVNWTKVEETLTASYARDGPTSSFCEIQESIARESDLFSIVDKMDKVWRKRVYEFEDHVTLEKIKQIVAMTPIPEAGDNCVAQKNVRDLIEAGFDAVYRNEDLRAAIRTKAVQLDPSATGMILDATLSLPDLPPKQKVRNLRRLLDSELAAESAKLVDFILDRIGGHSDIVDTRIDALELGDNAGATVMSRLLEKAGRVRLPEPEALVGKLTNWLSLK